MNEQTIQELGEIRSKLYDIYRREDELVSDLGVKLDALVQEDDEDEECFEDRAMDIEDTIIDMQEKVDAIDQVINSVEELLPPIK